ncbi:MAG: UDP-N-acetylglucosamine 4,6-dehydratase (inverting) [Nitrospina sp.]|nr:UDP-N-acetylglucosamine 4,6-dehydratase (inverting) [Nitrospina sp.]
MDWSNKTVLITGGTGSFGRAFVDHLQKHHPPKRLIIFSRDEMKQYDMEQVHNEDNIRYCLGDVRELDRLKRTFRNVDIVVHAAALKMVLAAEYNPSEAIQTNILGGQNVIDAAIEEGVQRVVALSTDKAVSPANLYGATKLCSDRIMIAGNGYAGGRTIFSVVRYGNVVGSRGSVVPLFQKLKSTGELPITDPRMTRFWLTLDQGVHFVLNAIEAMHGGEIFVPKIPSMRVVDLARAIGPECRQKVVGIRPGEKIHETLISQDDARSTVDLGDYFVIKPYIDWPGEDPWKHGKALEEGFCYRSDKNDDWLTVEQLTRLVQP